MYGADDIHDFARHAILRALNLDRRDRLLDIGCGGGLLLRDAARSGARVTGLDHSEEMVALARERAPGAEVVLGDAERLPFADAAFTAVSMSVVFHFLEHPVAVLRECERVLARAGGSPSTRPARSCAAPRRRLSRSPTTVTFTQTRGWPGSPPRPGSGSRPVVNDGGGQLLSARR